VGAPSSSAAALQASAGSSPAPAPPPRADGRLPSLARPLGYELRLAVDPARERFEGTASIRVEIAAPTTHLVMHGRDLRIARATIRSGALEQAATASTRLAAGGHHPEELVLSVPTALAPGPALVRIAYDAPFSDGLQGLYRVKEDGAWYAFTQFEATAARRAFPCFDEPGFKVPFEVSIEIPAGQLAFGNTPETSREQLGGRTTFRFAPSPPMPSYLVAFAVGPLEVRQGPSAPVPIRLVAPRGKTALGQVAIETTDALVQRLGDYFGIRYPYAKLDIVAVPDFAAGAMENPGLITFREILLLLDPARASRLQRRWMAEVVAHELAHQWFGNLVTTAWWNDLWLNEGFATWMEQKVVDAWRPSFGARIEAVGSTQWVMTQDALASARAVRQPVVSTSEAMEAFDGITYRKGAKVLAMTERWVGEEAFRKGVRRYLEQNAWKAARAEDLLGALSEASGKDVAAMAATFLDRPGVPVVESVLTCRDGAASVKLSQAPWRPLGSEVRADAAPWQIPVCVAVAGRPAPACALLRERAADVPLGAGACPAWVYPNAGEAGYYRFAVAEPELRALARGLPRDDVPARIGLVANAWAAVRAGRLDAGAVLRLLPSFDQDTSRHVIEQTISVMFALDHHAVADGSRERFHHWVAERLRHRMQRVGWPTVRGNGATAAAAKGGGDDEEDRTILRNALLDALGRLARDDETLRRADELATAWLKDRASVDPDAAMTAVTLGSMRAGRTRFEQLRAAVREARSPHEQAIALRGLGGFSDPEVLRAGLDLTLTDEVKVQDMGRVIYTALGVRESRPVVFAWAKQRWDALRARLAGPLASRLVWMAGYSCDRASRDELARFLGERARDIEGAQRPLAEAVEEADLCIALRAHAQGAVETFFSRK
jgi:aminopeptidase N